MGLSKCKLGKYIELREITNVDYSFDMESVRGVNNLKQLMPTKADLNGRDLSKFQIVYPDEFVCDVQIPIPNIGVQKSIAEMHTVYNARKKINEQLKAQIKNICPILIRGSLEE